MVAKNLSVFFVRDGGVLRCISIHSSVRCANFDSPVNLMKVTPNTIWWGNTIEAPYSSMVLRWQEKEKRTQ